MLPVLAKKARDTEVLIMSVVRLTRNQLFACVCFALALVTFAVYWPMLSHGFVNYDDPEYITGNPHVTAG